MNVLVTGAAGFIGSHTVLALLESNFNVIGIDNFCNSIKSNSLKNFLDSLLRKTRFLTRGKKHNNILCRIF